jgi:hypothetical protein
VRAEPEHGLGGEADHFIAFLAYYRSTVVEKARSLPDAELRRPLVPSGWTPLELVQHLAFMERRWFVWGFLGEDLPDPWGDSQGSSEAAWLVPSSVSLDDVVARLTEQAVRTDAVLSSTPLEQVAATTGRFRSDPPDLRHVCFHVLQEYARHAGHLDIAVELAGGPVGE